MSESSPAGNYFATLSAINVSEHIERKGNFSYISWPYAVSQLRLADPTATWDVRRFDGLPYLACEAGVFVEVAVTVQGITLSQIHPVLDARNRPLTTPTSFDINTSIQRALVKAIALHGLGLYIYAGEDLPQAQSPEAANDPVHMAPQRPAAVTVTPSAVAAKSISPPTRPAMAKITKGQQAQIHKLAVEVGISLDRVLSYFGVRALSEIEATDFHRVVRSLENKRAAA
jgi:hypothetical protein